MPASTGESAGLELDLGDLLAPSAVEAPPEQPEAGPDMGFSLDLPEIGVEAAPESTAAGQPQDESISIGAVPVEEGGLDFDFDMGMEAAPAAAEEKAETAMPELDLSGISLDLAEPAAQFGEAEAIPEVGEMGATEVATKLDLARAYVEMGDTDGAREILEEVLKEGSEQQQAEANQLLSSI
jgi:pilus assembly protein FimV